MLKRVLRSRRGEGYIDVCVLVICAMLVIALAVKIMPVYIAKQQLDTFATELVREAELYGRIGTETTRRLSHCGSRQVWTQISAGAARAASSSTKRLLSS